ncbi:MAG: MMPL family transporter [Acholeplasmatales bacterium]|nr:MMPL family transporter [Acholeplasmatales bacterium]
MLNKLLNGLGKFLYKFRYFICALFIILFGVVIYGQNKAKIAYSYVEHNKINDVFKDETTCVVVYNNEDENKINTVIEYLSLDEHVTSIQAYSNTLGVTLDYNGMAYTLQQDVSYIKGTYQLYFESENVDGKTIALYDYMVFLNQIITIEPYKSQVTDEQRTKLKASLDQMTEGKNNLIGENHSRLIFNINYEPETKAISNFFDDLDDTLNDTFENKFYLVGDEAMSYELSSSFYNEYLLISIISALAIFIVIVISFKKFMIPTLLILVIECSVFITLTYMAITNMSMYFLALIIVQCMLMGSMVDYGILMSNYYIEVRCEYDKKECIPQLFKKSLPTILTSGSIMVLISLIIGNITEGTVSSIIFTLGIGAFSALVIVIFILPSLLTTFDKLIIKKKKQKSE